ncbi:hypothetical protein CJ030_MR1G012663 [Morella rubra]|uniref:Bromo domain-containing protein n=1 Tax=Morella rubra TaxID=262757 RepID=A0A6A1WRF4_9ROSI|nr:hypothetical protein CJ030_MR1G012663 [Morella rubra]
MSSQVNIDLGHMNPFAGANQRLPVAFTIAQIAKLPACITWNAKLESERYKSWIRQHLDLQTVQSRLDRGVYEDCVQKFFRDLLLLFNNGVVFFRKSSSEHAAARELRAIVRKELNHRLRKPQSRTVKPEPSREPDTISKPSKQSSMVVCGKRSSMKALIAEGAHRKVEKREGGRGKTRC